MGPTVKVTVTVEVTGNAEEIDLPHHIKTALAGLETEQSDYDSERD
ncbi:MAG: hypothetical protein ACYTG0_35475 [Planctomycetota bacterium]|jgi:hypothetical protein